MSTQVVRIEGFTKGSLQSIGNESERGDVKHRNADIDTMSRQYDIFIKSTSNGFYQEFYDLKTSLNAQGKETKDGIAFEGMLITADTEFFANMGWKKGQPLPAEGKKFFKDAYDFALREIGYRGTDKNVMSAVVHVDETTPHLQLYYLPITERWQEKVYAKDENGHVLRSEKGTPLQSKDENGKTLYRQVEDLNAPKLARSEFWRVRGGNTSYRQMQDHFHESVGQKYGLERGEVGSDREHKTKAQWEAAQLKNETAAIKESMQPYKDLQVLTDKVEAEGKTILPGVVAVKKKDLDTLKEQAKAYTVNQPEVDNVRLRSAELDKKESVLQEKEKDLNDLQEQVMGMYDLQIDLNRAYDKVSRENDTLRREIFDKSHEIANLKGMVYNLQNALESAKKTVRDIVMAINLFRTSDRDYGAPEIGGKKLDLLHGITKFAFKFFKKDNDHESSKSVSERASLSESIKDCMPRESRNRDQEHEM